ncbi:Gag-Pro-Pol polyprotein [Thelohanellus kitauei]|uniref:Gag-Pro-Pol polyprotein n=1 Tax=Thelohanellus kitauei TaxID=669202 RepID=A0A0C2NG60_THEKT|nr:Gag-Pro-Pol polyprotein [Thelohanellus kitauei]
MKNIIPQAIISTLKSIFSLERFPLAIVSDNGRQFSSSEFEDFCTSKSIKNFYSPPYHPQSNGLAEVFVQTFKTSISKSLDEGSNLEDAVVDFLCSYRSTPFNGGKSPSEMLHGLKLRN